LQIVFARSDQGFSDLDVFLGTLDLSLDKIVPCRGFALASRPRWDLDLLVVHQSNTYQKFGRFWTGRTRI